MFLKNLKQILSRNTAALLFFGFIFGSIILFTYNNNYNERQVPILIQRILSFDKKINQQINDIVQFTNSEISFENYSTLSNKLDIQKVEIKAENEFSKSNQNPKVQNLVTTYEIYLDSLDKSNQKISEELAWQNSLQENWRNYATLSDSELSGKKLREALEAGQELLKKIQTRADTISNLDTKTKLQKIIETDKSKILRLQTEVLSQIETETVAEKPLNAEQLKSIKSIYDNSLPSVPNIPRIQITDLIDSDVSGNRKKLLEVVQSELDQINQ